MKIYKDKTGRIIIDGENNTYIDANKGLRIEEVLYNEVLVIGMVITPIVGDVDKVELSNKMFTIK